MIGGWKTTNGKFRSLMAGVHRDGHLAYVGMVGTVASPIASLSKIEQMEDLERNSLDFYAMMRSVVEQKRQAETREALKESLLSALPGLEDRSGEKAGTTLVSPALSSPALESPALSSPATGTPLATPPPAPSGEPKQLGTEPAGWGWTLVIERQATPEQHQRPPLVVTPDLSRF